jgi:hypothetical protein
MIRRYRIKPSWNICKVTSRNNDALQSQLGRRRAEWLETQSKRAGTAVRAAEVAANVILVKCRCVLLTNRKLYAFDIWHECSPGNSESGELSSVLLWFSFKYIHSINFSTAEQIFMKLVTYIMAPESISMAYFINSSLTLCQKSIKMRGIHS